MLYKKYRAIAEQSASINLQIATVLAKLREDLIESDRLFKDLKAYQAIALGEKNGRLATGFAAAMSEGIQETLANGELPRATADALKELEDYFLSIAVLIAKFNYSRDQKLFERLTASVKAMEETWRAKG